MGRLMVVVMNTVRSFSSPVFNFIIALFGIKTFGKQDWAMLINAMLWIFLITFSIGWGNKDYLIRRYSAQPAKNVSCVLF